MITYTIDSSDLKSLAKVMRAAGPDLNRRMRREIRTVAKPVIDEMKDTIEAMQLMWTVLGGLGGLVVLAVALPGIASLVGRPVPVASRAASPRPRS